MWELKGSEGAKFREATQLHCVADSLARDKSKDHGRDRHRRLRCPMNSTGTYVPGHGAAITTTLIE